MTSRQGSGKSRERSSRGSRFLGKLSGLRLRAAASLLPWMTLLTAVVCILSSLNLINDRDQLRIFKATVIGCEVRNGRPLGLDEIEDSIARIKPSCRTEPSLPAVFPEKNVYASLLQAVFLHDSLGHLGWNLAGLTLLGLILERRRRRLGFLVVFLASGTLSMLVGALTQPQSTAPIFGASGSVTGLMGFFATQYPEYRFGIPAKWGLAAAVIYSIVRATSLASATVHGSGFLFGCLIGFLVLIMGRPKRHA